MADAYGYASEGRRSPEIEKLRRIERFGLEAITGRPVFLHRDYVRLVTVENIAAAYADRQRAENWAAWASEHPGMEKILNEAAKQYAEYEYR